MKKLVVFLFMVLQFQLLSAQITFEKKYGNPGIYQCFGTCALQTDDTGYIVTGTIIPYSELPDLYLAKMNPSGDTVWTKSYGSANGESGQFIKQTSEGGFIIAATKSRYQLGVNELWLVKTDEYGDTLWTKTYTPNFTNSEVSAYGLIQTNDGGYLIFGGKKGDLSSNYMNVKNIFLVKTNSLGDTIWTKQYFGEVNDMKQTNDGSYVICGEYYEPATSNGHWNALLMRLDSSGDSLWAKTYENTGDANSMQQTSDQGYIITGTSEMISYGNSDIFLIKTNSSGDTLWTKIFGGSNLEEGNAVCQTSDSGYIVVGMTRSFGQSFTDAYLIKTNINGDTLWTKAYGYGGSSSTIGNSVNLTFDGGYIIGGQVEMLGTDFLYLLKTNDIGTLNSVKLIQNNKLDLLNQNYPNPVKFHTVIKYYVTTRCFVSLNIYNSFGRKVTTLVNEVKPRGSYSVDFYVKDLPDGCYFYRIEENSLKETKKLTVIK